MPKYEYAKVAPDGSIMEVTAVDAPLVGIDHSHENKPRWLPVETEQDECDPVSQIIVPHPLVVDGARVLRRFEAVAKSAEDIANMIAGRCNEIEGVFQRLWQLPIQFTVNGEDYEFHADQEAVDNIMGCLMAYREGEAIGIALPDPRNWTPKGFDKPIAISRAQLTQLGLAIYARKDALFACKKAKQAQVRGMSDAHEIDSYDVSVGWE